MQQNQQNNGQQGQRGGDLLHTIIYHSACNFSLQLLDRINRAGLLQLFNLINIDNYSDTEIENLKMDGMDQTPAIIVYGQNGKFIYEGENAFGYVNKLVSNYQNNRYKNEIDTNRNRLINYNRGKEETNANDNFIFGYQKDEMGSKSDLYSELNENTNIPMPQQYHYIGLSGNNIDTTGNVKDSDVKLPSGDSTKKINKFNREREDYIDTIKKNMEVEQINAYYNNAQ